MSTLTLKINRRERRTRADRVFAGSSWEVVRAWVFASTLASD
jgi:hypothetical protein